MAKRNPVILVAVITALGAVFAAAVGSILQPGWWRFERNSKTDFVIAGRVVDQMTNEGLGQASLSVAGRSESDVSEDNGNFRIELHGALPENGRARLLVTKPGYAPHDETVMPTESLIIALNPAPKTKSEGPSEKTVQSLKNPLEVVAFDSSNNITIANNGPLSVYVVSLNVKSEQDSRSYELGFDIEPGKFYKHPFPPPSASEGAMLAIDGKEHFRIIMPLAKFADTWNEHLRKAVGLFQKCGMMLIYFSPSDSAFLAMKDAYSYKPERPLVNLLGLGYGDASCTLYYRVKGFTETKEQSVPLVVIVAIDGDRCPHAVAVPFTPTQSHP